MNIPKNASERFDIRFPVGKCFDLVGLGQNTVDHICVVPGLPRLDTKMQICRHERVAGGQVAGAVVFACRLGLRGKYLGKVGSDDDGRFSADSLRREGVDISSLLTAGDTNTHLSIILVNRGSGERTILWERDPRLNFQGDELKKEDVCAGRLLLLDASDPGAALQAADWAHDAGIPVVSDMDTVDCHSRELIARMDFLIVSFGFPREFTGIMDAADSLLALQDHCRGFVAMTLGAQGAMAVLADRCVLFPAFRVRAVDTTGAGDIFRAGFIYGLLQNWPLELIMSFANAAAALNCMHIGARAGMPSLSSVFKLMDESH